MGKACSMHGDMIDGLKFLVGKPEGRRPSKDTGVDKRIILK
jgi:hypothetical protein